MRTLVFVVAVGSIGILGGCDSAPPKVEVYPVTGQVLYGGKAAAGVRVYLLPTSAPTIPEVPNHPYATTDAEGKFALTTYKEGDGAPEGGYQVLLFWPKETTEDEEESDEDRLLGWYDAVHSQLAVEVKAGENQLPVFNLPHRTQPPSQGEGVPGRN